VVAEKARGGNFKHFRRDGGNNFFSATTAEIFGHYARNRNSFSDLFTLFLFYNLESKYT
jgi:hypothetical protein